MLNSSPPAVAASQPVRPGQRILPLHRLDPVMQDFFREQIERGEVAYWIVAGELCIAYTSLVPYTAAGTDELDWEQTPVALWAIAWERSQSCKPAWGLRGLGVEGASVTTRPAPSTLTRAASERMHHRDRRR